MSYILSKEQRAALVDVSPADIRAMPSGTRLDLAYRHSEVFWTAVQGFALGAVPIAMFLGVKSWFK